MKSATLIIGSTSVVGAAISAELVGSRPVCTAGRREADFVIDLAAPAVPEMGDAHFDAVVLVAADFGGVADADLIRAEEVNAVGTLRACAVAAAVGATHVVLISTISAQYRPGHPYYGIYALSKRHGEETAALYCAQRGIALTTIQATAMYDTAGRCRQHQPLLYSFIDRASAGSDITIYGSADPERNFLHVDDLALVVSHVLDTRPQGTFVCASPESLRLSALAQAALTTFGRGGEVRFDRTKADVPGLGAITGVDLFSHLGCAPTVGIHEGLGRIRDFMAADGAR